MLWRPIYSDPQIYTLADLRGRNAWVTMRDVFDANEALDLIAAARQKEIDEMQKGA